MRITAIAPSLRATVVAFIAEQWGSPLIVTRGRVYAAANLPGFVALTGDEMIGLITYHIADGECEIVSLNSQVEKQGIGTALIERVAAMAKEAGCRRLWLITTNDNTPAIRFYQRRGFDLAAVHLHAIDRSRQIKPEIPLTGLDDIPIRHELEFGRPL